MPYPEGNLIPQKENPTQIPIKRLTVEEGEGCALSIGLEQKEGAILVSGSNTGWGYLRMFGSGAEGRDRSVENVTRYDHTWLS